MKTRTKTNTRTYPTASEMNGYIDIVPYQQKGDPCYGGDTGETEYENYIKGTPELYHEREYRTIVREIIPHLYERDGDDAFNV